MHSLRNFFIIYLCTYIYRRAGKKNKKKLSILYKFLIKFVPTIINSILIKRPTEIDTYHIQNIFIIL